MKLITESSPVYSLRSHVKIVLCDTQQKWDEICKTSEKVIVFHMWNKCYHCFTLNEWVVINLENGTFRVPDNVTFVIMFVAKNMKYSDEHEWEYMHWKKVKESQYPPSPKSIWDKMKYKRKCNEIDISFGVPNIAIYTNGVLDSFVQGDTDNTHKILELILNPQK